MQCDIEDNDSTHTDAQTHVTAGKKTHLKIHKEKWRWAGVVPAFSAAPLGG